MKNKIYYKYIMNNIDWYKDFSKFYNQLNTTIINKHHFESYNDFIEKLLSGEMINNNYFKLKKTVNGIDLYVEINRENIKIIPSSESPNECRLKNKTYHLKVIIDEVTIILDDIHKIPVKFEKNEEFILCEIPILLLSNYCYLYNTMKDKYGDEYKHELYKHGECINELGGYFIIDGKEKIIISQERLAYNKLYTHTDPKYILITEVKSAKTDSFTPAKNTYIKLRKLIKKIDKTTDLNPEAEDIVSSKDTINKENMQQNDGDDSISNIEEQSKNFSSESSEVSILVSFPGLTEDIPLFIIFRALGYESDKEIYELILKDLLPYNKSNLNSYSINNDKFNEFSNILEYSRIDALPITTRDSAIKYIYRKLEHKINLQKSSNNLYTYVLSILYNNLLPHQENNLSKSMYLGYMAFNLLKVYLNYDTVSNRDTFEYKQIETSGYLLSTLFREYYIKFKNSLLIQLTNEFKLHEYVDKKSIVNKYSDTKPLINLFKHKHIETIITDGFHRGFKGNWGVRDTQKVVTLDNLNEKINRDRYAFNKEGLVQDLLRVSYLQTISHLRRIQTPIDSSMKIVGPRKLNATQWGYVCPVDTPDGGNSGLIKNMAMGCLISTSNNNIYGILNTLFNNTEGFISFNTKNYIKPTLQINNTKIFIDGGLVGIYVKNNILDIVDFLRLIKRNNLQLGVNNKLSQMSVAFNYEYKELYILTDFGRCIRPVYVLDYDTELGQNKIIRSEKHNDFSWNLLSTGELTDSENSTISGKIKSLDVDTFDFIDTLREKQACIEFIDPQESLYTLICLNESDIQKKKYKYLEINGKLIFGALPSIIPFMNHNPKTRNLFCMAQAKQSVGIFASNFSKRMDTFSHVLYYPQTPIVNTKISTDIKYNDMPGGENVVIAVASYTGYNQEDAIIINKSALDRGLFISSYYRTYIEYIEEGETFGKPDVAIRKNGNNYSKLDDNGIIKNNTYVTDQDIIIGKTTNNDGKIIDKSITIHHNDFGVVDGIYSHELDKTVGKFCKVRIRMERTPEFADKFGSRHGLKGVVGMILDQEDMPFTKDGIVPDIIMNPHGVPSRMSTGHLLECLTGKSCSLLGSTYDASPFENTNELENITNILETSGYEQYGNEILYNGYTGEQMMVSIFTGVQYYQRMKHMVRDKVQSRDTGPKTVLERQPAKGRAREGGLRLGEMERDSIISHGIAGFLKESYTVRSDNYKCYICKMCGRIGAVNAERNIYSCKFCNNNHSFDEVRMPYCTKLFIQEMESQFVSMRLITDKY